MRSAPITRVENNRLPGENGGPRGENIGAATFRRNGVQILVVFSDQLGWDHVSVSLDVPRCPTWDEMCFVKDIFFREDELAIQYHPRAAEYVKVHPFVLHLWRPQSEIVPTPPLIMV